MEEACFLKQPAPMENKDDLSETTLSPDFVFALVVGMMNAVWLKSREFDL